jgi:hypothetical protein
MICLGSEKSNDSAGSAYSKTGHVAKIIFSANEFDYEYELDNISFIRTNDVNYAHSDCNHEITETVKPANCTEDGVFTRECTVDGCEYVETEYIPNLGGHNLSGWTDIAGNKQQKTCSSCDYVITRNKLPEGAVQFDDGTVTDGGKLSLPTTNITISDDGKSATDAWGYASWTISDTVPLRDGETALRIQTTKANYASGRGINLTVAPSDGVNEGDVYTLDFDFYSENTYYNGTRQILQLYFGGSVTNFDQSKNDLKIGSAVLGTWEEWISLRVVYTVANLAKTIRDLIS